MTADAPSDVGALATRGATFMRAGDMAAAEACLRQADALSPGHPVIVHNLGLALLQQDRPREALAFAERTLAGTPDHLEALVLQGEALLACGQAADALAKLEAAARRAPSPGVAAKVARARHAVGDLAGALEILDTWLASHPGDALLTYWRGVVRLHAGDFAGGWVDYEARWRNDLFVSQSAGRAKGSVARMLAEAAPPETLAGRRVLLIGEQGFGDQLMFSSMIPDLAREATSVTCVVDRRLVRLLAQSFPTVRVVGPGEAITRGEADVVLGMGSLGRYYRRDRRAFGGGPPYLAASEATKARWAERLGPRRKLRVGLSWRGGTVSTRRSERSLALAALAPILALAGCDFVSLQYGDPRDEVREAEAAMGVAIRCFAPEDVADLDDLAGVIANLDVVVSVQTAVAHLCGATGAPCLVMTPRHAEWRYGAAGASMPWYGSIELFRQADAGDWAPVIEAVRTALTAR